MNVFLQTFFYLILIEFSFFKFLSMGLYGSEKFKMVLITRFLSQCIENLPMDTFTKVIY